MTDKDFNNEVLPLKDKMFRLAKRLLNWSPEAEDVTQDVFLKLWNKKQDIEKYRSVEALAMTMTKNMCLDKLKAASSKNVMLDDHQSMTIEPSQHKQVELNDSMTLMHSIIDRLPAQQKVIVQLRDIEGYEFEEISKITDTKINAVRTSLSRARQTIREEMKKAFDYESEANRRTVK